MGFWKKDKSNKKIETFYRKKKSSKYKGQQLLEKIPNLMTAKRGMAHEYKRVSPRLAINLFLIFLVAASCYFLFSSPFFKIQDIVTVGNKVIHPDEIREVAGPQAFGKNIFLFDSSKLKTQLLEKYPRVESATISRSFPRVLKVRITERPSTIVWKTGANRYLVDPKGYVIEVAKGDLRMPEVTDLANVPIKVGSQIVTEDFISFVNQMANKLTRKTGFNITSINIAETTFEVQVVTDRKIYFLFDTTRDLDTQLEYLTTILQDSAGKIKQYVDLRVESRVFYK